MARFAQLIGRLFVTQRNLLVPMTAVQKLFELQLTRVYKEKERPYTAATE